MSHNGASLLMSEEMTKRAVVLHHTAEARYLMSAVTALISVSHTDRDDRDAVSGSVFHSLIDSNQLATFYH